MWETTHYGVLKVHLKLHECPPAEVTHPSKFALSLFGVTLVSYDRGDLEVLNPITGKMEHQDVRL